MPERRPQVCFEHTGVFLEGGRLRRLFFEFEPVFGIIRKENGFGSSALGVCDGDILHFGLSDELLDEFLFHRVEVFGGDLDVISLPAVHSYFTDDTLMTLAVAKALCNRGRAQDIALYNETIRCMRVMGSKYPDAGWGLSFAKWLKAENPQPYQSFGNGAAMRISPVGEYARSEEEVRRLSKIVTSVSHDHPDGLKGAECVAMCVYVAKNGAGREQILQRVKEEYYPEITSLSCEELSKTYTFDESCQGTVPQALACFFEGEDFEDTIRNAISIGGDSDTVAAIAGGVAEAFFGIPTALIDVAKLYLDDDLLRLAENIEKERKKNG